MQVEFRQASAAKNDEAIPITTGHQAGMALKKETVCRTLSKRIR
jgi:hypothetical protein